VEGKDGEVWLNFSSRDWLLNSPIRKGKRTHVHRTIRYREDQQAPETQFTRLEDELNEPANAFFSWTGMDRWEDTSRLDLEYAYRLSGRDWTPFSRKTEIALLDLAAGDYTIEVKARDHDFNVDPSPAVASFRVIPPLWKQAWFIVVIAGVVATTILLIVIIIRQRITHAIALSEFKVDFFAKLSHELRTPLSVILGPLDRLLDQSASTEDRKALEMIQRNATKLLGLVNQLLEFRKVELGKMECHPSTGEIVGFVNDILYSLSPLWEQKKQRVEIALDERPFTCAFDPDKVLRICDNLLANAIKYTPEGGEIRVSVQVLQTPGKADVLDLRITDTGVGIPKARLKHITEPFYTAGNGGLEKTGSGLGLALVKEMVDLCKGTIQIESETDGEGKGTRVHVSLPLLPAERIRQQATDDFGDDELEPDDDAVASQKIEDKQQRILVVEDNPDLRHFLRTELSRHFKVDTAENGVSGIRLAHETHPDLIISDVMMPEMNGIELCRKIRGTTEISHIPIILLTARTGETHYLEGIESGADEYFSKPVSVPKLVARIENLLKSRQKLHQLFADQVILEPKQIAVLPADQLFLRNAINIAEENMQTEDFDVEAFAKQMAVSRATLNRKIKAITGTSPKAFIRSMRIKRASQLLASSDLPINEIFFQVGFYDASNFSRVFKKETGMTPSQYRDSHQKQVHEPEVIPEKASSRDPSLQPQHPGQPEGKFGNIGDQ
jgi:signal transduction histidine kinase/DNA-binding response OmpR family regulator